MRNGLVITLFGVLALCAPAPAAQATEEHDGYHTLRVSELPEAGNLAYRANWRRLASVRPYAVLDGPGRATLAVGQNWSWWSMDLTDARVAVLAPRGAAVTGRVYVPSDDFTTMRAIMFRVDADDLTVEPDNAYYEVREAHYRELWHSDFAGAAWFRHQMQHYRAARGVVADEPDQHRQRFRPRQRGGLNQTYDLFTGARAAGENLQLNEFLQVKDPDTPPHMQSVDEIAGITIEPVNWGELVADLERSDDALAMRIPSDQYAIFLPDLESARRVLTEMEQYLMPVVRGMDPQTGEADLAGRYLRQLALPLHELDSVAMAAGLRAIAVTGSDPYWSSGTDLAIMFEVDDPAPLMSALRTAQARTAEAAGIKPRHALIHNLAINEVGTDDRRFSSHLAQFDEQTVVLSNSPVQMERLHQVASGERLAMGELDEFTFMNNRHAYRNHAGTAVMIITDDAIRKWGSARWRIAASRRIRMLETMLESQARALDAVVGDAMPPDPSEVAPAVPNAGTLHFTGERVVSSVYNTPAFLTPIAELAFDEVTMTEAEAYRRWRNRYQSRWQAFCPIGLTLTLDDERIEMELTVLPLIRSSEYRNVVELAGNSAIGPHDGDPHDDAIVHYIMAIDASAPRVREMRDMARMMGLDAEPFAWVGQTLSVYLDDDPIWEEVLAAEDFFEALEERANEMPLGIEVAVRDRMRMAAFMVALRGFVQQTVPGLTIWENFEHVGTEYVRITADMDQMLGEMDDLAIYYAVRSGLTLTFAESVLHRSIERHADRRAADRGESPHADDSRWLGEHMALHMRGRAFELLSRLQRERQLAAAQRATWRNLPILNEWRQRYPDLDPMTVHETFAYQRLICPGGGEYAWNEKWQTMESTLYGHPGEPREGPLLADQLRLIRDANFGISFEHDGLHGRAILLRSPVKQAVDIGQ